MNMLKRLLRISATPPIEMLDKKQIVLIGIDSAGKTTFMYTLINSFPGVEIENIAQTIGFNIEKCEIENVTLSFSSAAGMSEAQIKSGRYGFNTSTVCPA